MRGKFVFMGLSLAVSLILTGCASTSTSGSRVKYYSDLEDLAADSIAIVSGEIQSQTIVTDLGSPDTVSQFMIHETLWDVANSELTTDKVISIRQLGTERDSETPSPILEPGQSYVLFVTPSGLDGELATQFYITGGGAGTYEVVAGSLNRISTDPGDLIPRHLTFAELEEAIR